MSVHVLTVATVADALADLGPDLGVAIDTVAVRDGHERGADD